MDERMKKGKEYKREQKENEIWKMEVNAQKKKVLGNLGMTNNSFIIINLTCAERFSRVIPIENGADGSDT